MKRCLDMSDLCQRMLHFSQKASHPVQRSPRFSPSPVPGCELDELWEAVYLFKEFMKGMKEILSQNEKPWEGG